MDGPPHGVFERKEACRYGCVSPLRCHPLLQQPWHWKQNGHGSSCGGCRICDYYDDNDDDDSTRSNSNTRHSSNGGVTEVVSPTATPTTPAIAMDTAMAMAMAMAVIATATETIEATVATTDVASSTVSISGNDSIDRFDSIRSLCCSVLFCAAHHLRYLLLVLSLSPVPSHPVLFNGILSSRME